MKVLSRTLVAGVAIAMSAFAVPASAAQLYDFYDNGVLVGQLELTDQGQECYVWGRSTSDYVYYNFPGAAC
jgi:hypothetical protein